MHKWRFRTQEVRKVFTAVEISMTASKSEAVNFERAGLMMYEQSMARFLKWSRRGGGTLKKEGLRIADVDGGDFGACKR